jgi:hypothetical protein
LEIVGRFLVFGIRPFFLLAWKKQKNNAETEATQRLVEFSSASARKAGTGIPHSTGSAEEIFESDAGVGLGVAIFYNHRALEAQVPFGDGLTG